MDPFFPENELIRFAPQKEPKRISEKIILDDMPD